MIGNIIFVVCALLFVGFVVALVFGDEWIPQVWMKFKIGRDAAQKRKRERIEHKEELKATWAAESRHEKGFYQAQCVKRTKNGRIVAMYEIGSKIAIDDESFSILRTEAITLARIRAEELNGENI